MAQPAFALPQPESQPTWPAQGEWTWGDYLRLPDDGHRYEIIEGVLYVTAAPIYAHQFAVYRLARVMGNFVEDERLGEVLGAPFDIRLPGVADPVQPDLVFFRSGNEPEADDKYFTGVPDLVVEILSRRTRRLDKTVKLRAYERAGVSEYWLVDPDARSVTAFHLDEERHVFEELGRFGSDHVVHSLVLSGFETAVAPLFPAKS